MSRFLSKNHDQARAARMINRGHIHRPGRLNDKLRAHRSISCVSSAWFAWLALVAGSDCCGEVDPKRGLVFRASRFFGPLPAPGVPLSTENPPHSAIQVAGAKRVGIPDLLGHVLVLLDSQGSGIKPVTVHRQPGTRRVRGEGTVTTIQLPSTPNRTHPGNRVCGKRAETSTIQ